MSQFLTSKKKKATPIFHEVTIPSFEKHWDVLEVKTFSKIAAK